MAENNNTLGGVQGPPKNAVRGAPNLRRKVAEPNFMAPLADIPPEILDAEVNKIEKPSEATVPASEPPATQQKEEQKGKQEEDDGRPRLLTPAEEREAYLSGLAAANVNPEEASQIMDAVLFKGAYCEDHLVCNRIPVTLRTRSYRDLQRTVKWIENMDPVLPARVNDLIARYNLAASLQRYGDVSFEPLSENATEQVQAERFQARLDFLDSKPNIVIGHLVQLMHAFDFKVNAVFAKGAPEDF